MHTSFYASGFLYHAPSQQILLQQLHSDNDPKLVLFSEMSHNGNNPQAVFQHCVEKALRVAINPSSIYPVYDYILDRLGEQFIFYVEVSGVAPVAYSSKNKTKWFLLSKLSKFPMSEQTRHDIIIGERVIRSRTAPTRAPQPTHH